MNITKETAIELAKEAGIQTYLTPLGTDEMHGRPDEIRRLCNLAIKHAQKDAEPVACAHDDTALLRQALKALKELWDNFGVVCPSADLSTNTKLQSPPCASG